MTAPTTEPADLAAEAALGAVTLVTVYGFVRLFSGTSFLGPLVAVAVVAHVVAAAARRWHWSGLLAALAVALASLLTFTGLRYRAGALLVVPTPATFSHMHRDLTSAAQAFRSVSAPTAPRPGFVLVLAVLVALVAFGADSLAFRLRARAEAVVPATGLFVFGAILGGPRMRLECTALFAVAALVFVLLHRTAANRRSNHWVRGDTAHDTRGLLRAGAIIVGVTSLVGVAAATAAPHQDQSPWTRWRGTDESGGTRVTVSPLVDLHDRLVDQTNVLLFTVKASQPAYWRLTALDHYANDTWSSNNSFSQADGKVDHPSAATTSRSLQQQFSLVALAQVWAPAAYQATKITGTDKLLYDPGSGTLIVRRDQVNSDGLAYSVTSSVPSLTPTELQQGTTSMSKGDLARYTQLPADFPADARAMATTVIDNANATTEYAKALALQNWFRGNFVYSLNANYSTVQGSALSAFLQQRQGWCEQFSGVFAAMARSLGIPTRVAVGFTPGRADLAHPGTFDVYGRQAHAWPEVWFPDEGWVAFEPTPGRGAPGAQQYTGVPYQQDDAATGPPQTNGTIVTHIDPGPGGAPTPTTAVPQVSSGTAGPSGASSGTGTSTRAASKGGSSTFLVTALLVVGVLGGLLGLLVGTLAAIRWWLRARRRRTAHTATQRVAVSWQEACDAVALVTRPPIPTETRLEFAVRAGAAVPETRAPLGALADLATETSWTDGPTSSGATSHAATMASDVDHRVKERLGPWRHALVSLHPRVLRDVARRR